MTFFTEKQTDFWLESQTRDVALPDGSKRPVRAPRLLWEKADSLVLQGDCTPAELVAFALNEVALQGIHFDAAYRSIVAHLDNRRRDAWGI